MNITDDVSADAPEKTIEARGVAGLTAVERLNFLVTNRIPRRALTVFMGWFSKIENRMVYRVSMFVWQKFADDLRLHEAQDAEFRSLHDCFTRKLKPGARTVCSDENVITSPCDAVVGEFGIARDGEVLQAKGYPYEIVDLVASKRVAAQYRNCAFVTLRLKSSMYHRFHAPCDGRTASLSYISGDTWNVNPVALKVIDRLFCKNERVTLEFRTEGGGTVLLVLVAAVLVASMRIHGIDVPLNLRYAGPNEIIFRKSFAKGHELGYFEHGSTIVVFASDEFTLEPGLQSGSTIRMGEALFRRRGREVRQKCATQAHQKRSNMVTKIE